MTTFSIKRIYEPASPTDGYRVLVDRLWPRGVSKDKAKLDEWAKDIAPSTELRKWFNHDIARFSDFTDRYIDEIKNNPKAVDIIATWRKQEKVTLLYGAKDEIHNEANAIALWLEKG